MDNDKFWRIRMRYSPEPHQISDYSERAWKRGQVGIWYGAWSAHDYEEAIKTDGKRPEDYLNTAVTAQRELYESLRTCGILDGDIGSAAIATIKRFYGISKGDWVVACFGEAIHLGRVATENPKSDPHDDILNCIHPKAEVREVWKYLEVEDRKSFPLSGLPDFYRIIQQYVPQGNIFRFQGNYLEAVRHLAQYASVTEVQDAFRNKSVKEKLDFMGPESWESFCLGYLIRMRNFVPTGLNCGRTLKHFDMVGTDWNSGKKVYAQCKKHQMVTNVEPDFFASAQEIKRTDKDAKVYYFPYGGCSSFDSTVIDEVIDGKTIMESWLKTEDGHRYLKLFFNY